MKENEHDSPLISVLLPCYNVEKYLEESVGSVLNQTYTNFEIIAIDDCSTDNTFNILNQLAQKDGRIKVYRNETNLKLIRTLNSGVALCNGKYIARMDADDISLPERFSKEVAFLENNPDYGIVSTQFHTFKDGHTKLYPYKNPTDYEQLQAYLLFKSGICHPASMIRKTVFTELGLKFETEYLHVEDYAFWSKAIYVTKLANIPGEPLLYYRVHAAQVSSKYEELQTQNKKKVFKIHCKKLNLDYSDEAMEIYSSVAEANPVYSSIEFLEKCEDFMCRLIKKNEIEPFCCSVFLNNMLALHWIRLCANSRLGLKIISKCKQSGLYNKNYYKKQDIAIFYFKCLFKIKYKKSWIYNILFR